MSVKRMLSTTAVLTFGLFVCACGEQELTQDAQRETAATGCSAEMQSELWGKKRWEILIAAPLCASRFNRRWNSQCRAAVSCEQAARAKVSLNDVFSGGNPGAQNPGFGNDFTGGNPGAVNPSFNGDNPGSANPDFSNTPGPEDFGGTADDRATNEGFDGNSERGFNCSISIRAEADRYRVSWSGPTGQICRWRFRGSTVGAIACNSNSNDPTTWTYQQARQGDLVELLFNGALCASRRVPAPQSR